VYEIPENTRAQLLGAAGTYHSVACEIETNLSARKEALRGAQTGQELLAVELGIGVLSALLSISASLRALNAKP